MLTWSEVSELVGFNPQATCIDQDSLRELLTKHPLSLTNEQFNRKKFQGHFELAPAPRVQPHGSEGTLPPGLALPPGLSNVPVKIRPMEVRCDLQALRLEKSRLEARLKNALRREAIAKLQQEIKGLRTRHTCQEVARFEQLCLKNLAEHGDPTLPLPPNHAAVAAKAFNMHMRMEIDRLGQERQGFCFDPALQQQQTENILLWTTVQAGGSMTLFACNPNMEEVAQSRAPWNVAADAKGANCFIDLSNSDVSTAEETTGETESSSDEAAELSC